MEGTALTVLVSAELDPFVGFSGRCGGGIAEDASVAVSKLPLDEALEPATSGADAAKLAAAGGAAPPAVAWVAAAPWPIPTTVALARPATVLAAVVMALTTVIIVLPTSPLTMRLAINGISAIEREKILAVRASSIIWLDPTKLFSTPFEPRTALMLERFTADMRTCRIA